LSEVLAGVLLEAVKKRCKVTAEILYESGDLIPVETILDCGPLVILALLPLKMEDEEEGEDVDIVIPDSGYYTFSEELLSYLLILKIHLFWLAPLSWNLEKLGEDGERIEEVKNILGYFPIVFSSEKPKDILEKMTEAAEVIRTR